MQQLLQLLSALHTFCAAVLRGACHTWFSCFLHPAPRPPAGVPQHRAGAAPLVPEAQVPAGGCTRLNSTTGWASCVVGGLKPRHVGKYPSRGHLLQDRRLKGGLDAVCKRLSGRLAWGLRPQAVCLSRPASPRPTLPCTNRCSAPRPAPGQARPGEAALQAARVYRGHRHWCAALRCAALCCAALHCAVICRVVAGDGARLLGSPELPGCGHLTTCSLSFVVPFAATHPPLGCPLFVPPQARCGRRTLRRRTARR